METALNWFKARCALISLNFSLSLLSLDLQKNVTRLNKQTRECQDEFSYIKKKEMEINKIKTLYRPISFSSFRWLKECRKLMLSKTLIQIIYKCQIYVLPENCWQLVIAKDTCKQLWKTLRQKATANKVGTILSKQ
jgi:hypothetical protein